MNRLKAIASVLLLTSSIKTQCHLWHNDVRQLLDHIEMLRLFRQKYHGESFFIILFWFRYEDVLWETLEIHHGVQVHKHITDTSCCTRLISSLNRKPISQLEAVKHAAATSSRLWSSRMLIEACLKQMTVGCYQAQSPGIHLQCWHLKHLMFILWRRWDNPLSKRHKHSTLGTWLSALSPIQPIWLQRTVGFIQDNSSPKMEHWEREDKGK